MEHKRITVEEAQAAYETTGVKPQSQMYFASDLYEAGEHCGCPAFVVAVARSGKSLDELLSERHFSCVDLVDATFDEAYLTGFTSAIDGRSSNPSVWDDEGLYLQGREDGLAVRAAIWPEAITA